MIYVTEIVVIRPEGQKSCSRDMTSFAIKCAVTTERMEVYTLMNFAELFVTLCYTRTVISGQKCKSHGHLMKPRQCDIGLIDERIDPITL